MDLNTKRDTILPNQLWRGAKDVNNTGVQASPPIKVLEKNPAYRMGVPIKASEKSATVAYSKKISPNKYHKSYNIDQAGPGVIALKDTENLPICLIKDHGARNSRSLRGLQFASHRNLVSLIDHFLSGEQLYLVYEYEHLAISLGCVAGTVQFSEADIATVCREILEGLKYIHSALKTGYGLLDFSNILLTWQGEVKLANIGKCLLDKHSSNTIQKDIKDIGSIVVFLSDRPASIRDSSHDVDIPPLSGLAHSFVQKTKEDTTIEQLVKHR
ncbi:uncharacterized protein N7458_004340 [Penicillium daleae]|uniref:Protein kinase domain-containing protein n=1 Tax=Penicillium daleae TaxID=63821 RepID=A0AAD6C9Z9_9EURO|nr:uncharacterized protein N7458_004340 [Penicillium daleae]KAJ5456076.1 hypothetical protein N7458_004340 [Penicillium daleae]